MQNYQVGSDTSQPAQIITGQSEFQSCFKHSKIVILRPNRAPKDRIGAKNIIIFLFIGLSYSFHRLGASKKKSENLGKQIIVKQDLPLRDMSWQVLYILVLEISLKGYCYTMFYLVSMNAYI